MHLELHGRPRPNVRVSKERVWRGQCTGIWNTFTVWQALPVPSHNTLGNVLPVESVSKINFNHQRKSCNPELPAKAVPSACLCSWISVVRSNWQCLREETKNKWQMLVCSSGRIPKIHHKEDAISAGLLWLWCLQNLPHLTMTGSWLMWETLCRDTDFSSSPGCKLKLHHLKQRKCSFKEGEKSSPHQSGALLGRLFSSNWNQYRALFSSDWNIHKLVYNLMLQVKFSSKAVL